MEREEYLYRIKLFEQEARKIEEQVNLVNQQIADFENLKLSLNEISEKKEVLANLGKGIFFNSEVKDKELFVNIGSGIAVKRNKEETAKIVNKQIRDLEELKDDLLEEIKKINLQLQNSIENKNGV